MGNSGSAQSAVPNTDDHNNYRRSPSQWSQSIPRDPTNRHTHQIKVLPELKGGARLRATNNGNILHGGGTLSGRRDLVLHNGVFRTRSTSSTRSPDPSGENVCVPHPHQLMQRSQTQLNIIRKQPGLSKLPENNPIKRFGSEPDLRGSGDERNDVQKGDSRDNMDKNNFTKTKLIRNKKKKAAPLPPIQAKANQASIERKLLNYDPSRFGWKKQDENVPVLNKENVEEKEAPKKLRLFKTKAEMQKVNEVTVIPKEIEKQSSARNLLSKYSNTERQSFNSLPYHEARNNEFDRLSDHHEESVPPLPQLFRREKSFDLSLLMQQKESNFGINSFADKKVHVNSPNDSGNHRSIPVGRISSVESKFRSRKFSQPVTTSSSSGNNAETDFKKELLAATRRRSQNIVLKTKDESSVSNVKMLSKSCEELENNSGSKKFERSENTPVDDLKHEDRRSIRKHQVKEGCEEGHQHQQVDESATKTFYFGMSKSMLLNEEPPAIHKSTRDILCATSHFSEHDSESTDSSLSSALIDHFPIHLIQTIDEHLNDPDSNPNGIQVHMRPTLPRRQYEVPRFSPAAAWKNLAQGDCDIAASPDESTNVCDKQNYSSYSANDIDEPSLNQQLLESRIERVYRDPVAPFLDNKSGDSGISGDAGMLQERIESPTVRDNQNNDKIGPFLLPNWTPLQDLGEESSSDDAEMANSKEELTKLVNRGHVFSLSLPRESHLLGYGGENFQAADVKTFNSLQKLKRTVSSAFGGSNDSREKNKPPIYHNENWMCRSAPNSIDNNLFAPALHAPTECGDENEDFIAYDEDRNEHNEGTEEKNQNNEYRSYNRRPRQQTQTEHSKILPPSFTYLTGGKHLMYLPNQENVGGYDEPDHSFLNNGNDRRYTAEVNSADNRSSKHNVNDLHTERENLQDPPEFAMNLNVNSNQQFNSPESQYAFKVKNSNSSKSRNHHRFTFQSTVRQIERRRLAERLSKDAEQKEAQRLSELEAMRRVEEEFQKKRAREKASIRHQLRLYSLGENEGDVMGYTTGQYTSLPIEWKSNGTRDEPDGAVSSPVPSPTSQNYLSVSKSADSDAYVDTKTPYISRIIEQKSGKLYNRSSNLTKSVEVRTPPTEVLSEFHTTRREYVEYRNSRKTPTNKSGRNGSHLSSPMTYKTSADDQPSDNYRKSFAHGRSICSSDSDMSGPVIRSITRHKHRSRSPSPEF